MRNSIFQDEYLIFNRLDIGNNSLEMGVTNDFVSPNYIVVERYSEDDYEFEDEHYYDSFVDAAEKYSELISFYAFQLTFKHCERDIDSEPITKNQVNASEEISAGMLCVLDSSILAPDKRSPDYQLVYIVAEMSFADNSLEKIYLARCLADDKLSCFRAEEILGAAKSDLASLWVAERYSDCYHSDASTIVTETIERDEKFLYKALPIFDGCEDELLMEMMEDTYDED